MTVQQAVEENTVGLMKGMHCNRVTCVISDREGHVMQYVSVRGFTPAIALQSSNRVKVLILQRALSAPRPRNP